MKISRLFQIDWGFWLVVLLVVGFIAFIAVAIGSTIYAEQKFQSTYPVGSAVQLKGLNIKGNVVNFNNNQVTILVTDTAGQTHQLTTEAKLLTK